MIDSADGQRSARVAGALLGVHAGDALGATLEFQSWSQIRDRYSDGLSEIVGGGPFDWPAGHATDDTDLTRAVLLAYLAPGDDVVTTALAVGDRKRRIRESVEISAITHDDPRCTAACAAYNEIVAALLEQVPRNVAVQAGQAAAAELGSGEVMAAIEHGRSLDLREMAATGQPELPDGAAGYVLDSLTLAVAAVLDRRRLRNVIVDVIRIGNDTDTNGAIAGGLLGARDGANAIPPKWLAALQFADEFRTAVDQLTDTARR